MSKKEEDYFLENIKGVEPIKKKNKIKKKIIKIPAQIIDKDILKKQNTTIIPPKKLGRTATDSETPINLKKSA